MTRYLTNTTFWIGVVVGVIAPFVYKYVRAMVSRGGKGQGDY